MSSEYYNYQHQKGNFLQFKTCKTYTDCFLLMKEVYRATVSLREFSSANKRLYVSAWITVWKCVITFLKPFETKMPEGNILILEESKAFSFFWSWFIFSYSGVRKADDFFPYSAVRKPLQVVFSWCFLWLCSFQTLLDFSSGFLLRIVRFSLNMLFSFLPWACILAMANFGLTSVV